MNICILKFGGKTLKDEYLNNVLRIIKNKIQNNYKVVSVVSAIGRYKDPYATETLRNLVNESISTEELDRLLACGEIISSVKLSDFLNKNGIKSISLDTKSIGFLTDSIYNDANIIDVNTDNIKESLKNFECVIVPGFQGINLKGNVTTLGRGGSDTTAVAIGHKIKAKEINIISDVNGIYSGDPKIIIEPKFYKKISYDQLINITNNGSVVLHHKAAKIAAYNKLNIIFRSIIEDNNSTQLVSENYNFKNISCDYDFYKFSINKEITLRVKFFRDKNFFYFKEKDIKDVINQLTDNNIEYVNHGKYIKVAKVIDNDISYEFIKSLNFIKNINIIHNHMLQN